MVISYNSSGISLKIGQSEVSSLQLSTISK